MRGGFFRKNLLIGGTEILCRLPLVFTLGYLARSVGAEVYGVWVLLLVVQTLATSLGGMGLSSALSRFSPAASPSQAHAHLRLAFQAGALGLGGMLIVALPLKSLLGQWLGIPPAFEWLLPVSLLMAVGSVADGYLDAYFKARDMVRRQVVFILCRTAAEIIAVFTVFASADFPNADEALATYVAIILLIKLVVYPWLLRDRSSAGVVSLGEPERTAFLKYGWAMLPTLLVIWLTSQVDRVMLGQLVSKGELGVYAFSATLASYLVFLGYAVTPLLLPRASRLYDEGRLEALRRLFAHSQTVFLAIMTAALVVIALFSREILAITAGNQYAAVPDIFLILGVAVCLDQLLGVYQYVFHLVKRPRWIFVVNLLQALLAALLVSVSVRLFGGGGAPWGMLAAVALTNLIRYRLAIRLVNLPMPTLVLFGLPMSLLLLSLLAALAAEASLAMRLGLAALLLGALGALFWKWRVGQPEMGLDG